MTKPQTLVRSQVLESHVTKQAETERICDFRATHRVSGGKRRHGWDMRRKRWVCWQVRREEYLNHGLLPLYLIEFYIVLDARDNGGVQGGNVPIVGKSWQNHFFQSWEDRCI